MIDSWKWMNICQHYALTIYKYEYMRLSTENIPEFPLPSQANVSLLDSVICTHISEAQGEDLPTNTACVIPTGDSVKLCDVSGLKQRHRHHHHHIQLENIMLSIFEWVLRQKTSIKWYIYFIYILELSLFDGILGIRCNLTITNYTRKTK